MAKKYYCVKVGRKTGLFTDINEYQSYIRGYPGFVARGFNSLELAYEYLGINTEKKKTQNKSANLNNVENIDVSGYLIDITETKQLKTNDVGSNIIAYVDGSYYEKTKKAAYAVVVRGTKKREICFSGILNDDKLDKPNSLKAEITAAIEAMKFAYVNGCKKLTIVYDCAAIKTIADGGKAKTDCAKEYQKVYKLISKIVTIEFKKITSHSSNSQTHQKYNNLADTAARSALSLKTKKTLQEHINKIIITHNVEVLV